MTKKKYSETAKNELLESLKVGVVKVSFTKVNGERRDMACTLCEDLLPETKSVTESKKKKNPDVQSVYDVDAKGWRSWRWENVIEFGDDHE